MDGEARRRKFEDINGYIASFPEGVQEKLRGLREAIKESAPEAKEAIGYGMPTFKLNGNLVHFAAYRTHIGFYPTPSAIIEFKEELSRYERSKGAVKFPIDEPVPLDLVKKIVKFRVEESKGKAKKRP